MSDFDYDLIVIGAGSGGTRTARISASYGAKTPKGTKAPYERSTRVVSQYVGETFGISTGKTKVQVRITDDMIGKKLGEFALTRKLTQHAKKTKKKKG